ITEDAGPGITRSVIARIYITGSPLERPGFGVFLFDTFGFITGQAGRSNNIILRTFKKVDFFPLSIIVSSIQISPSPVSGPEFKGSRYFLCCILFDGFTNRMTYKFNAVKKKYFVFSRMRIGGIDIMGPIFRPTRILT